MRRSLGIAALLVLLAGCGGAATPVAEVPTSAPSDAATATPVPTPEATPVPTPEPTAPPTPRITPRPVTAIIEAEHPAVKASAVQKAVLDVMATAPEHPFAPNAARAIGRCTDPDERLSRRSTDCGITIRNLYALYVQTGDEAFYDAALATYSYAFRNLGKLQIADINDRIQN